MFFKKDQNGPRDLDGYVTRRIAGEWSKIPANSDHWVKYLEVTRPHPEDKDAVQIRIFDEWEANQKQVKVTDYSSLDQHPDLVLFEGWYNKKAKTSEIRFKKAA